MLMSQEVFSKPNGYIGRYPQTFNVKMPLINDKKGDKMEENCEKCARTNEGNGKCSIRNEKAVAYVSHCRFNPILKDHFLVKRVTKEEALEALAWLENYLGIATEDKENKIKSKASTIQSYIERT